MTPHARAANYMDFFNSQHPGQPERSTQPRLAETQSCYTDTPAHSTETSDPPAKEAKNSAVVHDVMSHFPIK